MATVLGGEFADEDFDGEVVVDFAQLVAAVPDLFSLGEFRVSYEECEQQRAHAAGV